MAGTNVTPEPPHASPAPNKMAWLDALNRADVSHATFRVAYTIAMHANWDDSDDAGWSCYPSIKTIAREAGCTRKTVSACLSTLADHGWLSVQSGGFIDGRNVSNQYGLTIVGSVLRTLGVASSGRPACSPEDALPTSSTNSINQLHTPDGHDALHREEPDLTVAPKQSSEPASTAAGPMNELRAWWPQHVDLIIQETMQCAGGMISDELDGLLREAGDDVFADWLLDYGPHIPRKAAMSSTKAIGVLSVKRRTWALAA